MNKNHLLRPVLGAFGLWLILLGWLWRDSFVPNGMAFCNDAPLGLMAAFAENRWDHFLHGSWTPLVWLGSPALPLQPSFTHLLFLMSGPVFFGKFAAPLSLLLLACSAFVFCRSRGFSLSVSTLVGIAAALNGNFLSHAAWGLGSRATAAAFVLLALAALTGTGHRRSWIQCALAGGAIGLSVMEGADVGAILSLYVAAFALFRGWTESNRPFVPRALIVVGRLTLIVATSVLVALHALVALLDTQVKGVAILSETPAAREQRWDFATGWSFPKLEVIRLAIPGILGCRMDTPDGGVYWGNVGVDGTPQTRSNGGGEYAGVLVLLGALWAAMRAWSSSGDQPFSLAERREICFWTAAALISLLLAFGRFAPFYRIFYSLPYLSAIRMPMKFLHPLHLSLLILFGYGLEGMWRRCLNPVRTVPGCTGHPWIHVWRSANNFERRCFKALLGLTFLAVVFTAVYAAAAPSLTRHLVRIGFPPNEAVAIFRFSVGEVMRFAGTMVTAALVLSVVTLGVVPRLWCAAIPCVFGGFLMLDLVHAALPFIAHYDFQRRYRSNPVLDLLAARPWEGRVTARVFPDGRRLLSGTNFPGWSAVQNQWMEQQFPFNEIQTVDIWQMPRMPEADAAYLDTFRPQSPTNLAALDRLWQMTNVRHLIGPRGMEDELNRWFDPERRSFRPILNFDLRPKPDVSAGKWLSLDDLTAVDAPEGALSVVEFGQALPRVRLYRHWEVHAADAALLARLRDPRFDPQDSVLLAASPVLSDAPGSFIADRPSEADSTEILAWAPKWIRIHTHSVGPTILLLNERWAPGWQATVDHQTVTVLRGNHLMRAVAVPAGEHEVVFRYRPPMTTLWISLGTMLVLTGAVLLQPGRWRHPDHHAAD